MPRDEDSPAGRGWRHVPFAAAGAAVPLVFGFVGLWDGSPPPVTLWTVGVPLSGGAGALAAPVLAAVRAGRPALAGLGALASPLLWLVGSLTPALLLRGLGGDSLGGAAGAVWFLYFLPVAYVALALIAGLLTWAAYASR